MATTLRDPASDAADGREAGRTGERLRARADAWAAALRPVVATLPHWEILLAATVPAGLIARACYKKLRHAHEFSEIIAGESVWNDLAKAADHGLVIGLIAGFFAAALGLAALCVFVRARCGSVAEQGCRGLLAIASLPAVVWFAASLLMPDPTFWSLKLSAILLGLTAWHSLRAAGRTEPLRGEAFADRVAAGVLIPVFAAIGGYAAHFAAGRFGGTLPFGETACATVGGAIGCSAAEFGWFAGKSGATKPTRLILGFVQLPIAVLFASLVPARLTPEGRVVLSPANDPVLYWTLGAFAALAAADMLRRTLRSGAEGQPASVLSAISPWTLLLILIQFKPYYMLPFDDYHAGEYVLPWWLTKAHGFVPFWDFAPSRGLVNYLPGFLGSAFSDGSAASLNALAPATRTIYMAAALFPLFRCAGPLTAFVVVALMPASNNLSEIDLLIGAATCVAVTTFFTASPPRWLTGWSLAAPALVLIAVGQGGLWTMATFPLAAAMAVRLRTGPSWRQGWGGPAAVWAACGLACLVTPLGKMLVGAVRYGLEQSSVNSVAYGIPWERSWGEVAGGLDMAFEFARASFVAVALAAGVLGLRALSRLSTPEGRRTLAWAVVTLALTVLMIPRAAGRIDPHGFMRLGTTSVFALAMLLPFLLLAAFPRRRPAVLAVTAAAAGALSGFGTLSLPRIANWVPAAPVAATGTALGLSEVDAIGMPEKDVRQLAAIRDTLGRLLRPGETYLDLTNRSARQYYLRCVPPMESGAAYYNLPTEAQQIRAVERLAASPPPVVLIGAGNFVPDNGLPSLRAHLIYRYVVQRYAPVEIDGLTYLVAPDRMPETPGADETAADDVVSTAADQNQERAFGLLDKAFRYRDLGPVPRIWGGSFGSLSPGLRRVAGLADGPPPRLTAMEADADGRLRIVGPGSSITYDLTRFDLSGGDAGVLVIDLETARGEPTPLDVSWGGDGRPPGEATSIACSGKPGRFVIPLDVAPRWLLCRRLESLRIAFGGSDPELRIRDVALYQRKAVDRLPPSVPRLPEVARRPAARAAADAAETRLPAIAGSS